MEVESNDLRKKPETSPSQTHGGKTVSPKDVCRLLNEMLSIDPDCVTDLIEARVLCNDKLAEHESIQVYYKGDRNYLGILGVINGLFGVREDGMGHICVDVDDDGKITMFEETPTQL